MRTLTTGQLYAAICLALLTVWLVADGLRRARRDRRRARRYTAPWDR